MLMLSPPPKISSTTHSPGRNILPGLARAKALFEVSLIDRRIYPSDGGANSLVNTKGFVRPKRTAGRRALLRDDDDLGCGGRPAACSAPCQVAGAPRNNCFRMVADAFSHRHLYRYRCSDSPTKSESSHGSVYPTSPTFLDGLHRGPEPPAFRFHICGQSPSERRCWAYMAR